MQATLNIEHRKKKVVAKNENGIKIDRGEHAICVLPKNAN